MSYELRQEGDQRIIIGTIGKDFDIHRETAAYVADLKTLLDSMSGPAVYISDVRGYEVSFGDLTEVLGLITRGDMAVLRHPNLHKTIVVTSSNMVRMGTNALTQNQYGGLRTRVVMSLDEALEDAAGDLAAIA